MVMQENSEPSQQRRRENITITMEDKNQLMKKKLLL